jgi:L-methionine (R)-S-oxide reductase
MAKRLQIYEAGDMTVSFDPNVCKHSGVCLMTLPAVFDVRRARWIQPDRADPTQVAQAVQKCPSGALQFYRNPSRDPAAASLLANRKLLNEVAVLVGKSDTRDATARAIGVAIAEVRGYDFVGVYDIADGEVRAVGWSGDTPEHPRFPADQGLCGAAAKSGETVLVNDVSADPRYLTTSSATRSEMIVPVIDPATRGVVGTIDVASHRADAFGSEDRHLIEDCARAMLGLWTEEHER